MPDAKYAKIAYRSLSVVLPGTWANIPLTSPKEARRFVKTLIRRQVGTDDRLARIRADLLDETMKNIETAVMAGVHTYLMSLELLPGVPFPGAVLMSDQPWPDAARPGLGAGDVPRALREGFPGGTVVEFRQGPVLRVVELGKSDYLETPVSVLQLAYHMPYPNLEKTLYARVSLPNLPAADPFIALFDQIIDSIAFTASENV